jgi:HSP20 family protein
VAGRVQIEEEVRQMVMERWNPIAEMRRMDEAFRRLWQGFDGQAEEAWGIPLDVVQDGDHVRVLASLPGVDPKDISVTFENDTLIVKGQTTAETEKREGDYLMRERRTGQFYRALRLPDTVDHERAESTYENGVLTVSFPRKESKKARTITVKASKPAK